jgi:hypothetical protein
MFGLTDVHREEARRLLSLDEEGQRIELLAHALAGVAAGRESSEELNRLDREMLNDFLGRETGDLAGETESPPG